MAKSGHEMNLTDNNYHMEARRKQSKLNKFCKCDEIAGTYLPSFNHTAECTKRAENPHIGRTDQRVLLNGWGHRDTYNLRQYDKSDKGPVLDTTWREVRNSIGLTHVPNFKPDPKDTRIFVPSFDATFGKSAYSKPYSFKYSGSSGGCNC